MFRLAGWLLTFSLLQTTRIGVAVNGVRKHCSNKEVVALAKVLIRNWKQLLGKGAGSPGPSVSPRTWVLAYSMHPVWLLSDSVTTHSGSARVCLRHKCGICRWVSFCVRVPMCEFLCASCGCTHLCIHFGVQRCLSVPMHEIELAPTCAQFMYERAFVGRGVRLPQSLPFSPFSPKVLGLAETEQVEEQCHDSVFRLPSNPQKRKRRRKSKSQEEGKRAGLFRLEARDKSFSTKEKTGGRAQRQVLVLEWREGG